MNELVPVRLTDKANTIHNRIDEFLATEMMSVRLSAVKAARVILGDFMIYLARFDGISPRAIAQYAVTLQDRGHTPRNLHLKCGIISRFFKWCYKMGYTQHRWYEFFPKIRVPVSNELPQIIGHEEYLRIRSKCNTRDKEWLVVLGYHTGMRMGDCCSLRWSHINQEEQVIRKVQNKTRRVTGSSVMIPYVSGSDVHQFIVERWNMRDDIVLDDDNYVCPAMYLAYSANNKSVTDYFRNIFDWAGLPNKSFKHFRYTFESRLANSGMNMALAAKITGRSDPRVLMRYIRPDVDAAREGIAKAMELHHHIKGFK